MLQNSLSSVGCCEKASVSKASLVGVCSEPLLSPQFACKGTGDGLCEGLDVAVLQRWASCCCASALSLLALRCLCRWVRRCCRPVISNIAVPSLAWYHLSYEDEVGETGLDLRSMDKTISMTTVLYCGSCTSK